MLTEKPEDYKENDRVVTVDLDGSFIQGTLKRQDIKDMEWYVEYDDGESCLVLDWSQLFKF